MSTSPCQFTDTQNNTQNNNQNNNFNINAAGLTIFRGLLRHDFVCALATHNATEVDWLLSQHLMQHPSQTMTPADMLLELLLTEENLFASTAAHTGSVPAGLLTAAADEIAIMQTWLTAHPAPAWLSDMPQTPNSATTNRPESLACWHTLPPMVAAQRLAAFHASCGYGKLALHHVWRWDGTLHPVINPDPIRLSDLVGCDHQKEMLMRNTRLFVDQRRGNNLLLYGARGTGKSSMVKAIANELAADGLCLLELTVDHITDLPEIISLLHGQPRPYIIFIDDLSFESAGQSYKTTKAVLEGSVTALGSNTLIYATSNRRHLIVENWHDRDGAEHQNGEVRASDSMSEKFSLADRFGQTILFTTPNQNEYLRIVSALAKAANIDLPADELKAQAIKWALWQNGCSGRTARQFINSLPQK